MAFHTEHFKRLDGALETLQLEPIPTESDESTLSASSEEVTFNSVEKSPKVLAPTEHAQNLQKIIRQLRFTQDHSISAKKLVWLLDRAQITAPPSADDSQESYQTAQYEHERCLEYLLLCRAALQTYTVVLNSLIQQTLPLSEELYYWEEVLSSDTYTLLYYLQSLPDKLFSAAKEIGLDTHTRLRKFRIDGYIPSAASDPSGRPSSLNKERQDAGNASRALFGPDLTEEELQERQAEEQEVKRQRSQERGKQLKYTEMPGVLLKLIKKSTQERIARYKALAGSPYTIARHEIREKQTNIKKLREVHATALGILLVEGLDFEIDDNLKWRRGTHYMIGLMENVVRQVGTLDLGTTTHVFEENIFDVKSPAFISQESEGILGSTESLIGEVNMNSRRQASALASQLQDILKVHLPTQVKDTRTLTLTHGRPSLIKRFWAPAVVLLVSSWALRTFLTNNWDAIVTNTQESLATARDFFSNWVVSPTRKIIGTIRHDSASEVALMSRRSLTADMDSLERMVVDFAAENPQNSTGVARPLTPAELDTIRLAVKEGDLTPVLRAYEHDMKKPLVRTITGQLLRALLIQIQKTKVDVEVAISGIDRLLKSQELVFGFVGLTPGILVTLGVSRWVWGTVRGRGQRGGKVIKEKMGRSVRNIDRILNDEHYTRAPEGDNARLTYNDHGLVVLELYLMRSCIARMGGGVKRELEEDVRVLEDARQGVGRMRRVVERVWWGYGGLIR